VLVLAQLNRETEKNRNRDPQLSDLRESGAIEQDADVVLMINPQADDDLKEGEDLALKRCCPNLNDWTAKVHRVDVMIAKQRSGPTGHAEFIFRQASMRLEAWQWDRKTCAPKFTLEGQDLENWVTPIEEELI
jgi:replicative DNA helicase